MLISALALRFAVTIEPLCARLAAFASRNWAAVPVIVLVHGRLRRLLLRLDRLAARGPVDAVAAPRLRRPAVAGDAAAGDAAGRPDGARLPSGQENVRLPSGQGWLLRLVPESRQLGPQVEMLVQAPETLALGPLAGRLLRPLCRMMGIAVPPAWRLPPRTRLVRARKAVPEPEPARREMPATGWLRPVPARLRLVVPGLQRRRRLAAAASIPPPRAPPRAGS